MQVLLRLKSKKIIGISMKVKQFITSLDIFGYPISLTYNEDSSFKSLIGGLFTIMAELAILSYFLLQVASIYQNAQTTSSSYYYRDLLVDTT